MTQTTEAIFAGASYTTKGGWSVRFMLPDAEAAGALDARGAGQRYHLALIPIDDAEQPIPDPPKKQPLRMSARAAMLAKDQRFVEMIADNYDVILSGADMADEWLKAHCLIASKRDLDEDDSTLSRQRFFDLELEFDLYIGKAVLPDFA